MNTKETRKKKYSCPFTTKPSVLPAAFVLIFAALLAVPGCGTTDTRSAVPGTTPPDPVRIERKQQARENGTGKVRKEQLLGTWADNFSEHAVFDIREDSIFYTEHLQAYAYQLNRDTLTIHFPNLTYQAHVSFVNDTLLMQDAESGTNHFYRYR